MTGYMVLVSEMDMRPAAQNRIRETMVQYPEALATEKEHSSAVATEKIADGKAVGNWFMAEACDVIKHYAIPTAFSRYAAYMNIPLGKQ
jgi:hypothetical protein